MLRDEQRREETKYIQDQRKNDREDDKLKKKRRKMIEIQNEEKNGTIYADHKSRRVRNFHLMFIFTT